MYLCMVSVPENPEEVAFTTSCQCSLHTRNDYVVMIIATFGEFVGNFNSFYLPVL